MKINLSKNCNIQIELAKDLTYFSQEQLKAIKDMSVICDNAGLKIYGQIGIN